MNIKGSPLVLTPRRNGLDYGRTEKLTAILAARETKSLSPERVTTFPACDIVMTGRTIPQLGDDNCRILRFCRVPRIRFSYPAEYCNRVNNIVLSTVNYYSKLASFVVVFRSRPAESRQMDLERPPTCLFRSEMDTMRQQVQTSLLDVTDVFHLSERLITALRDPSRCEDGCSQSLDFAQMLLESVARLMDFLDLAWPTTRSCDDYDPTELRFDVEQLSYRHFCCLRSPYNGDCRPIHTGRFRKRLAAAGNASGVDGVHEQCGGGRPSPNLAELEGVWCGPSPDLAGLEDVWCGLSPACGFGPWAPGCFVRTSAGANVLCVSEVWKFNGGVSRRCVGTRCLDPGPGKLFHEPLTAKTNLFVLL
ncbi:uncharacterized protein BDR25DRAFT_346918 [Lindgomyces ingoldianus]|uniref:Uncharacterized protein n=1 Tax=Lindgomyces ingoldianus TaxID=673940 RepID=A0ACB6QD11_9PLEO|nr:uncharacterized protein BDR25DRAFT_346918 [Lindgomyces ingoldianus]KAF2464002.1 hypothetical protein BDR25DRAFT_346918 [Lindgomyces ingoldianus]